jgi:hypothetical protein
MQAPIRSKINQWFEQLLDFEFPPDPEIRRDDAIRSGID